MKRLLHHLKRDRRGTATIELALVAPLLATFIIGIVDISNAVGRKLAMEQAAQRGIEKIMQTTTDTTVDLTIVTEAAAAANVPVDQVTLDFWLECDGTRQADYNLDPPCAEGEREARYITLSIADSYTPMFSLHFAGIEGGAYPITAESGIRIK